MSHYKKKIATDVLYIAIVIGLVLSIWSIGAAVADSVFVLPGIPDTFCALGDVLTLASFWTGLCGTLVRSVISYAISAVLAALLFFLCSTFTGADRIISPIISALRTLPTMAVSLLLAIWAGANVAPVILGIFVVMPMIFSSLRARISTLPVELIEAAKLYGAGRCRVFFYVVLPYAASALPESLSTAFSFGIKIVIAAEILMQTATSLGMLMYLSQTYYETATLIALVFSAVVIAVLSEFGIRAILSHALKKYMD